MASGRAHALVSLVAAVPCGIAVGWLTADIGAGVAATVGCASGIALSPDLDMAQEITESERLVIRHLWVAGWLWTLLFLPYGWLFKHRGISHWPIVGTLGRLLYLYLFYLLLALWQSWPLSLPPLAWPWAAGLAWSDFLHWVLDRCPL